MALSQATGPPQGLHLTTYIAGVADEAQMLRFRDDMTAQHGVDHIHWLFNNAGIASGGSMIADSRAARERTFNIC